MKTVTSADGTSIAFDQGGSGPNLLLIHGTAGSRARWAPIRPRLEEHFTLTAIDRRGRGDSGDSPHYDIAREIEDVLAVVNALDPPIVLFGHSYGALLALEAAIRTEKIAGLVLYEPPIVGKGGRLYSERQLERLDALLASGDREGLVTTFMSDIVKVPPHALEILKSSAAWPSRVAAGHTLSRELRAQEAYRPADRLGKLSIPVLLLLGGDSPTFFGTAIAELEKALPNPRTVVMPGQQHIAMDAAPDLVIGAVLNFWRDRK